MLFVFTPESFSRSPRNPVRLAPESPVSAPGDFSVSVSGRTALVTAAGRMAYVLHRPSVGADKILLGKGGGASSVVLSAGGPWTAQANDSFLHISPSSAEGVGSALVVFTCDAFGDAGIRTGTLTVAGLTVTVTQAGRDSAAAVASATPWSAGADTPEGVAVDGEGNVYIADTGNSAIKRWTAATGEVDTVVSTGLDRPLGVAVDEAGNVYIADTGNGAIKQWNASSGRVSLLVSGGLSDPAGVAVDGSGDLYIADTGNSAIRRWSASTGQVTTVLSSGLSRPRGVAVDAAGNLYIADHGRRVVLVMPRGALVGGADLSSSPRMATTISPAASTGQIISFDALAKQWVGGPVLLHATASSGLPVTFDSATPAVCTVSGSMATLVTVGACSIIASQSGNASYAAASPVTQTFLSLSLCDVNQDGQSDSFDVREVVNESLGTSMLARDLNHDNAVNVLDIQMAINGATAVGCSATRRDVVMVLVVDRSSSMDHVIAGTNVIAAAKAAAANFTSQFQTGRDRLGLVVFGGSAMVAYPPSDWGEAWNSGQLAGPDVNFQATPDSPQSPNMLTSISNIQIGSNTGTADALSLAYRELRAANQPGALNVIVLLTDGLPNGISATFNTTGSSFVKSTSTCAYKNNTSPNPSMTGWIAQWGGFVAGGTTNGHGIFGLAQTDTATYTSVTDWLQGGQELVLAPGATGGMNGAGPGKGCAFEAPDTGSGRDGQGHYRLTLSQNVYSDVTIPSADLYGNSTLGSASSPYTLTDYQQSEIWANECNNGARTVLNLSRSGDGCQIGLASWNAADMAARQIHFDTTLHPVIYAMGFEGNGGDDPALMRRIANVNSPGNTVFDASNPQGLYLQIDTPSGISPAFQTVLVDILLRAL